MTMTSSRVGTRTLSGAASAPAGASPKWLYAYLTIQIACQVLLLVPGFGSARPLFRSLAFGTSFAFMLIVPGRSLARTLVPVAVAPIIAILVLSFFNPDGGDYLARVAALAFHLSIIAPVFWVARLKCDMKVFEKLLVAMWAFSTASAVMGVLQTTFPGRFQADVSQFSRRNLGALLIQVADGQLIPRPMGLTDTPGGAASGGFYAMLLGVGVYIVRPFRFARSAAILSALTGMTCLYLCQIRSLIVMLGVCLAMTFALLASTGRFSKLAIVGVVGASLAVAALYIAIALGGEHTTERLEGLIAASPGAVYYGSRGKYLEHTFDELVPNYPFGAGLGRWGQVANYFGNDFYNNLSAEIQWNAWVIDGGIPLLIVYPLALIVVMSYSVRLARRRSTPKLEDWSTVVAGYNLGAMALTFSYPIFASTTGLEFWLINASLLQAGGSWAREARARATQAPAQGAQARSLSRLTSSSSTTRPSS